jgi:hypothetical protein
MRAPIFAGKAESPMKSVLSVLAICALASGSSPAAAKPRGLDAECARVTKVYPLLMLASMMEGPVNCGQSDDGSDYVDCAEGETPQERAAHARRFEVRTWQEAGYKAADAACTAWEADKGSEALRQAAEAAIAEARRRDNGALAPHQSEPGEAVTDQSPPAGR